MKSLVAPKKDRPSVKWPVPRYWMPLAVVSLILSTQSALSLVGVPSLNVQGTRMLSGSQVSLLLAAYPSAMGVASLLSGIAADLVGRKRILVFGQALLAIVLIVHFFAQAYSVLLILRVVAGLAAGTALGLPSTILSECYTKDKQRTMIGRSLIGYAIGHTIGIPLGVLALSYLQYLPLCAITGCVQLAILPFWATSIPNRQTNTSGTRHARAYFKDAATVLHRSKTRTLAGTNFLGFLGIAFFNVTIVLWFYEHVQAAQPSLARLYLWAGCTQVLVLFLVGPILRSHRPATVLVVSFALNGIVLLLAGTAPPNVLMLSFLAAATAGITSARIPSFHFLASNLGERRHRGMRMSINQASGQLGKAIGSYLAVVIGTVWTDTHSLLISGGLLLACAIFSLQLRKSPHPDRSYCASALPRETEPLHKTHRETVEL